MNEPLIQCENLTKVYENGDIQTRALSEATFSIGKGEFVALMGPSGSGKSTLMHVLGLLDQATSGKYLFLGRDVTTLSQDEQAEIRNQKIGFIFQSFNLLPRTSVFENVELPLLYDVYGPSRRAFRNGGTRSVEDMERSFFRMWEGMSRDMHETKVMEALTAVGMKHRRDYMTNQLSGGEMQRVAIARALVNNPDIIFADEPTGNLDSKSGLQVMMILQALNDSGHTVVLVTHETTTAQHAKRMLYMKDGKIVADDTIQNRRIAKDETELAK
ncbi:MAG: ABC transporter ATP-binding protein [Candidatus Moranbacteria bacterium]|nr:ABC transporter ATP-binding protein [Candidatus Moranbacteria bacterium]